MKERLLTAFWHRGRKEFVPWLVSELALRVKARPRDVEIELLTMSMLGLAQGRNTMGRAGCTVWEITPRGQSQARAILTAQAKVRAA